MEESLKIEQLHADLPPIVIPNVYGDSFEQLSLYEEIIKANLKKILSQEFYQLSIDLEKINFLKKELPSVTWDFENTVPATLSIRCIYNYRLYSSKFIYDIISRWLIPGKRLNILSHFGCDFAFKDKMAERYIIVQFLLNIESREDLKTIRKTLPMLASEIRLGVTSLEQGMRILEIKGLNIDDKINLVQESIVTLMSQKPENFDKELFIEMQHFFLFSQDIFKELREYRHLVRIICWQYLFRKGMSLPQDQGGKRLIRTKLIKTRLHYPYGAKTVLGILVGISYLRENEKFGEQQITRAIQNYIPEATLVSKSFLVNRKRGEEGIVIYAEFEKNNNVAFSYEELSKLRTELSDDLRGRIEQSMHPIFMPRNEEEIMRNILNLSRQLKSYDDIPQIIISFDNQSENHIMFIVVLLRVVKNDDSSIQEICNRNQFKFEFIPDRIKIVGHIKKRLMKEANVFYIRMDKHQFLRKDHSLDLYKARQEVLNELYRIFRDVRDYNGGMIAKENETFNALKQCLKDRSDINDLVLENFFYALAPPVIRSMVEVKILETAFRVLKAFVDEATLINKGYVLKLYYQSKYMFTCIASADSGFQRAVNEVIATLQLGRFQVISSFINIEEMFYYTFIFHGERQDERKLFADSIKAVMEKWYRENPR